MALSYNEYIGDGSLTTFTTPPYLEKSHIQAVVGGEVTTAYTLSGTSLTFNTAPENGLAIRIVRSSSSDQRLTDYADASLLTADTLDLDSNQLFYLTQEALDTASETNVSGVKFYTASTAVPTDPTTGNLWFDINTKTLKIYNGTEWVLAVPTNSSHKFETFSNDEAGYSYVSLGTVDNSALVFLNGIKQVRSETKAGVISLTDPDDYFVDLEQNRIYFATLSADSVVEVVVNLLNNPSSTNTNTITNVIGGGGGGNIAITEQDDGTFILTDSFNGVSIVVSDGNNGSVPIPTITDNGDGTYTIDNNAGDVVTFSDGADQPELVKGVDYFDGDTGAYKSFIFATAPSRPTTPTGGSFDGAAEVFPTGWYDTPTASLIDIEWVSTTRYTETNGVWSNNGWSLPRLFYRSGADGADGADGANGTSVTIRGRVTNANDLIGLDVSLGDAYVVEQGIYITENAAWVSALYVCTTASSNSVLSDFTNVGQFQGEDGADGAEGARTFVHYAYANISSGVVSDFSVDIPDGRNYLGIYTQTVAASVTPPDPTDSALYTWQLVKGADGTTIDWKGTYANRTAFEAANTPQVDGMAYYDTGQVPPKSFIYQDGQYYQVAADGDSGTDGVDGMVWKGESALPPELPTYGDGTTNHMAAANWAYKDTGGTFAGQVRIYDAVGQAWELMVESGTNGTNGTNGADGADGINVYIAYNNNDVGTTPAKPSNSWPSSGGATNNGWSLSSSAASNWMVQRFGRTNAEGSWGNPIQISGANGSDGTHGVNGAGQFSGNMAANVFTNVQATNLIQARAKRIPVIGDVVTLSQANNRTNSVTKICESIDANNLGIFSKTVVLYVDGSLLVDGSIVGSKIEAGTINSTHLAVGSITAGSIKADSLDIAGVAISGSIGFIGGVAGRDVVNMTDWNTNYPHSNFTGTAPHHLSATSNTSDSAVGRRYLLGDTKVGRNQSWARSGSVRGRELMGYQFTTYDFEGTLPYLVSVSLDPLGLYGGNASSSFAFAMWEPELGYDNNINTPFVTTRGTSKKGTGFAAQPYLLNDLVQLQGNKTYKIAVYGALADVEPNYLGEMGFTDGSITVIGLNK